MKFVLRDALAMLEGSAGSRTRRVIATGEPTPREAGVAVVMVLVAMLFMTLMLAQMNETTATAYAVTRTERDALQAEYLAKSAIDLTRLVVAKEPDMRASVAPIYRALVGRDPPQLPVWVFADAVLAPFCRFEESREMASNAGIAIDEAKGLGGMNGRCEVLAFAENRKLNINQPLNYEGDEARRGVAMPLFALMGGYQAPSAFDPLFEQRDADGQFTNRLDVVSNVIDWWDHDQERTVFDPGAMTVTNQGAEDDFTQTLRDPYRVKNAPFDSLDELRLVRGIGDDFWATFVQSDPDDPASEKLTVYGSGAVNANEAPADVLLGRVCSVLLDQPLCTDPLEAAKFVQLVNTIRGIAPIPWFTRPADFIAFLEGRGGPQDLYPALQAMLGPENPLLFRPVTVSQERRNMLDQRIVTAARILTVQGTAYAGRARARIRTVLNFHDRWTPPPPNAGTMPTLGVFHYYRID